MNIQAPQFRRHDATLTAATVAAGGGRKATTARLLAALSAHEGDSDLGLLAGAILSSGPFCLRNSREEWEQAENDAYNIEGHATDLAEAYRHEAAYAQEVSA